MDQDAEMLDLDDSSRPSSSESNGLNQKSRPARLESPFSPDKNHRRFRVHRWTAIAMWSYDIAVDNCAICRNHIMDKCIECQSMQETSNIEENCTIAWGKCSHVFHMHCISRWLNTRQVCPLDNRTWDFKKYGT